MSWHYPNCLIVTEGKGICGCNLQEKNNTIAYDQNKGFPAPVITTDEAKHFDDNKTPLQWVLSMQGIDDVANVGAYGAKKYGQSNWRLGSEYMRYLGSCVRHITAVIRGQWLDAESGLPHLAHCAFDCLILLEWRKTGKGTDDRPKVS